MALEKRKGHEKDPATSKKRETIDTSRDQPSMTGASGQKSVGKAEGNLAYKMYVGIMFVRICFLKAS